MWRESRQALGLSDVDHPLASLAVPQQLLFSKADRQIGESPKEKVKMSIVIGQQDETDALSAGPRSTFAFKTTSTQRGRSRGKKLRFRQSRLLLWRRKIINRGEEPHADFTVLTLLGRRMQRLIKLRNWTRQPE